MKYDIPAEIVKREELLLRLKQVGQRCTRNYNSSQLQHRDEFLESLIYQISEIDKILFVNITMDELTKM